MSSSPNEPVKQHYIPQVYLRNFCDANEKVFLFDDSKKEIYNNMAINNVFFQKHFYTLINDDGTRNYKLEKWFNNIESEVQPIFQKVIGKQKITIEDKEKLSLFIALLQHRTPVSLEIQNSFTKPALKWMLDMHIKNGDFDDIIKKCPLGEEKGLEYIQNLDISLNKQAQWHMQIEQAATFANFYMQMEWKIFYTTKGKFITTDNPVVIIPEAKNMGIAIPGNLKIVPLSSQIILMIGDLGNMAVHAAKIDDRKQIRHLNMLLFASKYRFAISDNIELLNNLSKRVGDNKITMRFNVSS